MSQNSNYNPNYNNPYGPGGGQPDPNYPGTAYGGPQPPSGPNNPYQNPSTPGPGPYQNPPTPGTNPYQNPPTPGPSGPNSGYGPYNPYAPSTPTPAPGVGTGPNPYDPYAPTVASQGQQNPNSGFSPYAPPPPIAPIPTPPSRRGLSGRAIVLAVIALILVGGGIIFGLVSYNNTRNANAQATATAQNHATATGVAQAQQTSIAQTATAVASTYPFSATVAMSDPLTDNTKNNGWDENNFCKFSASAYHAIDNQANTYQPCAAQKTDFSNFTFEVSMTIKQGNTDSAGGILFRADANNNKFYRIFVGADGTYGILVAVDTSGGHTRVLKDGSSNLITTGINETNLISVVVRGDSISLYINRQLVTTVHDGTYSHGQIGVVADNGTGTTDVEFSNAKVWSL